MAKRQQKAMAWMVTFEQRWPEDEAGQWAKRAKFFTDEADADDWSWCYDTKAKCRNVSVPIALVKRD